jgi:hypothetical protein
LWYYGSGFVRYFIAGDPNFDPSKFRPEDFRARIEHISALMDSTDPDLSRYAARRQADPQGEHVGPRNKPVQRHCVLQKRGREARSGER